MINKTRKIHLITPILIFAAAFSVRFLLQDPVIMNDEASYGRWWGYLEEARFVTERWRQGSSLEDLMVNFMGHAPLSHFLAALSLLLFPFLQDVAAIHLLFQILSSLTCVLVYYIGKDLYDKRVGSLAGLFLAFSPLFINYGRCSYPHEPLAFFMGLSILALYKGVATNNYRHILISSICCGFAFSTHELSVLLPIIIIAWVLFLTLCKLVSGRSIRVLPKLLFTEKHYLDMAMYPTIALSTYIALFPWLWPDPAGRIRYMFHEYAVFGTGGHPIYFMGNVWHGPPIYTYAMYILGLTTPIELIMLVFGAIYLMKQFITLKARREDVLLILWFGIIFGYFSLIVVKFVHFSVIFYPPLSIICGLGLVKLAEITRHLSFSRRRIPKKHIFGKAMYTGVICLLLISLHIASAIYVHPHYEMYFSPLVGGPKEGVRLFKLEGGGVMYREAAEYIRQHCELNSAILFAGSALFCYYLPEHNVKPIWDYPTIDKLEPGIAVVEYLLSHNVEYVVFGLDWVQYNDKNVCYMTFKELEPNFVFQQYGVKWVCIYRVSTELLKYHIKRI